MIRCLAALALVLSLSACHPHTKGFTAPPTTEVGITAPVIWVYPDNATTPVLVPRDQISWVHDCNSDGDCLAFRQGDPNLIWVRAHDFGVK